MAQTEEQAERKPTERVILQEVAALVIPADATVEQVDTAVKALVTKATRKPERGAAWREVARHTASTKTAAIEAHAGKPGTATALVGTFRAPTITAWKDAHVYLAPPEPLVERSVVD